jgi:hypothetical protein
VQQGIVDVRAERVQVGAVPVRRQLHPMTQPKSQVPHEYFGIVCGALTHQP